MYSPDISIQTFQVRVVGVTYENRQAIVAQLEEGEQILLVREPMNPFDSNAIMVVRQNGQHFCYLDRILAAKIASQLDRYGRPVKAFVSALTGGYYAGSNLGVMVTFELTD